MIWNIGKIYHIIKRSQRFYSLSKFCKPYNIKICIINNGFLNAFKSILIFSKNDRYLINCGEGTQKLIIENGHKIFAVNKIFLTRFSPETACGINGIAMGLNGLDSKDLCLHGFQSSIKSLIALKNIGEGKGFKMSYHSKTIFDDNTFTIYSFKYRSHTSYDGDECVGYLFSQKLIPIDLTKKTRTRHNFNQQFTLSRKDPLVQEENNDPEIVEPLKNKFLVLDCPSIDHVSGLMASLPIDRFTDNEGTLSTVFHLTDKTVFYQRPYQLLVDHINSRCPNKTPITHIVIDSTVPIPLSYTSYYLQTCLNYFFDDHLFPKLKLYEDYIAMNGSKDAEVVDNYGDSKCSVIFAEPGMEFFLNNISNRDVYCSEMWRKLKSLNAKEIVEPIIYNNDYVPVEMMTEKIQQMKNELDAKRESLKDDNFCEYPNVTFIGTSSSTPSKYRNITSILLEPIADVFVLFDCGEGSLDRILMLHGLERGRDIIRNIRLICITHHHLDHHSGLYNILRYRQMIGDCKPCLVLAARNVQQYALDLDSTFQTQHCTYRCDWTKIDLLNLQSNHMSADFPTTSIDNWEKEFNLRISPVRVCHTATSYGYVLSGLKQKSNKGWKITFSGDTSPKFDHLVKKGIDSDLLIHEATFDDGMEEMAFRKRHSTVSQAIEEGVKMRAKFTMLTHFSSRHPLVPPVECKHSNVAQAYDFMKVDLRSCHYLKVLDPYLEYLFPRHWNELMVKREKMKMDNDKVKRSVNY